MENTVKPGYYRHFKGGLYRVIGLARHSETREEVVVYQAIADAQGRFFVDIETHVRPLTSWRSMPEPKVHRFTPVKLTFSQRMAILTARW